MADWLLTMVSDVTCFNEHIVRLRLRHFLGVLSAVSVHASTVVRDVLIEGNILYFP